MREGLKQPGPYQSETGTTLLEPETELSLVDRLAALGQTITERVSERRANLNDEIKPEDQALVDTAIDEIVNLKGRRLTAAEKTSLNETFSALADLSDILDKAEGYHFHDKKYFKALSVMTEVISDGFSGLSESELSRGEDLRDKIDDQETLSTDEYNELSRIGSRSATAYRFLQAALQETEMGYRPFDPELELFKLRQSNDTADAADVPGAAGRRERLESFKRQLLDQKEGLADLRRRCEQLAETSPETDQDVFKKVIDQAAPALRLSRAQYDSALTASARYAEGHRLVQDYRQKYPDDAGLFAACFGQSPRGRVEVIIGKMSLYFRCHNEYDYASIWNYGQPITPQVIDQAKHSGGVAPRKCAIPELNNLVIAEKSNGRSIDTSIYRHEEKHLIARLFEHDSTRLKADLVETDTNDRAAQERHLKNVLKEWREMFEAQGKDEILAYLRGGRLSIEILLKHKAGGGLYDYYQNWIDHYSETIINEMTDRGLDRAEVMQVAEELLKNKYQADLKAAFASVYRMFGLGYSADSLISILETEPLQAWPKLAERLRVGDRPRDQSEMRARTTPRFSSPKDKLMEILQNLLG